MSDLQSFEWFAEPGEVVLEDGTRAMVALGDVLEGYETSGTIVFVSVQPQTLN